MEYKVITEETLSAFEQTIREHLADGWRLYGILSFSHEYRPTFEHGPNMVVHVKPCYVRELVRGPEPDPNFDPERR